MAAAAKTTTTPRRTTRSTRAKTAEPTDTGASTANGNVTDIVFQMEPSGESKNFDKFTVPTEIRLGNGTTVVNDKPNQLVVGSIYAPKGTTKVLVKIVREGDEG